MQLLGSLFWSGVDYVRSWDWWTWFGLFAQFFFFLRFFAQWVASERAKRVVIPAAFWYFSIIGGILITVYAVERRDVPFTLGNGFALYIYFRNLRFHYRGEHGREDARAHDEGKPRAHGHRFVRALRRAFRAFFDEWEGTPARSPVSTSS